MPATESKKQIGIRGEDLACAELQRQGMQILERNWRCRLGEIDIVAAESGIGGLTLVFCEVKCRSGLGLRSSARGDHVREDADAATAGGRVDAGASHEGLSYPVGRYRRGLDARPGAIAKTRSGGGLSGVGVRMVRGSGRPRGPDRRGGGRHWCRATADRPGRIAGFGALSGPRSVQGGGQQLRARVADLPTDHQSQPGYPA